MERESFIALLPGPGRCPAHDDKYPSLATKEGDHGLLIHCFAGCSIDEICSALGLTVRDLFYDNARPYDPDTIRERTQEREVRRRHDKAALKVDARRIDCLRESDSVIRTATSVDISAWTDDHLDLAMDVMSDAWRVLCDEDRKEVPDAA